MRVVFVVSDCGQITAHYDDEPGLRGGIVSEIPPEVFDHRPLHVYEKAFEIGRQFERQEHEKKCV